MLILTHHHSHVKILLKASSQNHDQLYVPREGETARANLVPLIAFGVIFPLYFGAICHLWWKLLRKPVPLFKIFYCRFSLATTQSGTSNSDFSKLYRSGRLKIWNIVHYWKVHCSLSILSIFDLRLRLPLVLDAVNFVDLQSF